MLAAKETTSTETRIWGSRLSGTACIGLESWLSSTSPWGWSYSYDGTAAGRLVTFKFAELYRDGDTGLDYAVNRYLTSVIGRFLTVDPYRGSADSTRPQSRNRYGYAENDPVTFADPAGLYECVPGRTCAPPDPQWVICTLLVGNPVCTGGTVNVPAEASTGPQRALQARQERNIAAYNRADDFRGYGVSLSNDDTKSDCEKLALMGYKAGQVWPTTRSGVRGLLNGLTDRDFVGSSDSYFRVGVLKSDPNYANSFQDGGFVGAFQDSSNQVRHFVGWFAAGWLGGRTIAVRELMESEPNATLTDPDVALGLAAIDLGEAFKGDFKQLAQDIWHQICGQGTNLRLP